MSQAARYYIPEPSRWPIFGSIALLLMAFGAAMWLNHAAAGPYLVAAGVRCADLHAVRLVRHRRPRERRRQVQPAGRRLVPLGHGLVHLFRGDVLRGLLRGAVLHARAVDPGARQWRNHGAALAWLQSAWPVAGPGLAETFSPMGAWGIPAINTLILLSSGRHRDLGPLGLEEEQPDSADHRAVPDHRAGHDCSCACRRTSITTPTPR